MLVKSIPYIITTLLEIESCEDIRYNWLEISVMMCRMMCFLNLSTRQTLTNH